MVSVVGGLVIAGLLFWLVHDPRPRQPASLLSDEVEAP
jgi:hypothetical protein